MVFTLQQRVHSLNFPYQRYVRCESQLRAYVESLERELHGMKEQDVSERRMGRDMKIGSGGIWW